MALLRLCIKVGWGQGDGDLGMRVWGLGTLDLGMRDEGLMRASSMGRGDVWGGDVKYRDEGDAGCE